MPDLAGILPFNANALLKHGFATSRIDILRIFVRNLVALTTERNCLYSCQVRNVLKKLRIAVLLEWKSAPQQCINLAQFEMLLIA